MELPREGHVSAMSGTLYQENHGARDRPLSDRLVFWSVNGSSRSAAIELKSRNPKPSKSRRSSSAAQT